MDRSASPTPTSRTSISSDNFLIVGFSPNNGVGSEVEETVFSVSDGTTASTTATAWQEFDYFTDEFDLKLSTLTFTPAGNNSYSIAVGDIVNAEDFSTSAELGPYVSDLFGDDDDHEQLTLSFDFPIGGTSYGNIAISSNGYVQFYGDEDAPATPSDYDLTPDYLLDAGYPTLALFWADLDLSSMGGIRFEDDGDSATVTWDHIGTNNDEQAPLTLQLHIEDDGAITFSYYGISSPAVTLDENLL